MKVDDPRAHFNLPVTPVTEGPNPKPSGKRTVVPASSAVTRPVRPSSPTTA